MKKCPQSRNFIKTAAQPTQKHCLIINDTVEPYVLVLLLSLSAPPAQNKASVHQENNLKSVCERPGGEAAPLTCSPDPCAAVDHHRGAQRVAGPLGAKGLHHLLLLSLHSPQEVDESDR